VAHYVHPYGVSITRVLPGNVYIAVHRRNRHTAAAAAAAAVWLIGVFCAGTCRWNRTIKTIMQQGGRCSCGYVVGANFSGNCQKCIDVIGVRGQAKRGIVRVISHSLPVPIARVNKGKTPAKTVREEDDFEKSTSPHTQRRRLNVVTPRTTTTTKTFTQRDLTPSPKKQSTTTPAIQPTSKHPKPQSAPKVAGSPTGVPRNVSQLHNNAVAKLRANALQPPASTKSPSPPIAQPQATRSLWSQFPVGQDLSPDSAARKAAQCASATDDNDEGEAVTGDGEGEAPGMTGDGEGDAGIYDVLNASAVNEAQQRVTNHDDVHIDLGDAAGSTMASWWDTFMMGSRGGGFLARSLFSAAAQDSVLAENRWVGPTSVTQKKQALLDMRIKFLEWTEVPATNEWVRSKLFNIIVTNPKTYSMLKVTRLLFINSRFLK
jgi:hypothetical protein